MNAKVLVLILLLSLSSAQATDFIYECHQVRTTAEEEVATTPLRSVNLYTGCDSFHLDTLEYGISEIDTRLYYGGAILTHVSYGGYFTSTLGEVFSCKRPI